MPRMLYVVFMASEPIHANRPYSLIAEFFQRAFPTFFHPRGAPSSANGNANFPARAIPRCKKCKRRLRQDRKSIGKTDRVWHLFGKGSRFPFSDRIRAVMRRLIAGNSNGADLRFDGCDMDDAFDEV